MAFEVTGIFMVVFPGVVNVAIRSSGEFFLPLSIGAYTLAIHKDGFIPDPKLIIGVVINSDSVTTLQKDISLYPQ